VRQYISIAIKILYRASRLLRIVLNPNIEFVILLLFFVETRSLRVDRTSLRLRLLFNRVPLVFSLTRGRGSYSYLIVIYRINT
jgi:hypothetical protein